MFVAGGVSHRKKMQKTILSFPMRTSKRWHIAGICRPCRGLSIYAISFPEVYTSGYGQDGPFGPDMMLLCHRNGV